MQVLCATLCDFAADYQGKLCLNGAFDSIFAQQFPAMHRHCALALRIVFSSEDEGQQEMQINYVDSDGKSALPDAKPMLIQFEVPEIPEESAFFSRNFVLNLDGLPIPKPGVYSFDLTLGGKMVARVPLQAVAIKPNATETR